MNRLPSVVVIVLIAISVGLTLIAGHGAPLSWLAGFLSGACGALLWVYQPWRR